MSELAEFVPTRGSSVKRKAAENFEVVVFQSYKPKNKKLAQDSGNKSIENSSSDSGFNIKKAKHEIVKFAVSGMEGNEKQEAKVRLAIQLGAKPRKNKYINYKQLKEQKRKERQEKVEELKLREMGKDGVGKSTVTTKSSKYKRKEKGGLLEIYGKVSKPEVDKMKKTKRK